MPLLPLPAPCWSLLTIFNKLGMWQTWCTHQVLPFLLNQQGAFDVHHVYIGVYTTSMYVIIVSPLSC